ncbi:hypothetical protein [Plasmodium yoelii yoelii]|uniref:Uncharacterized protein n=1 Tax=Plasmodium yoelii yoelii TaxID=73239 RepID=Q7RRT7_PLAYO|nr:hypothetical protein [Plasmodium yoelii yoelii]
MTNSGHLWNFSYICINMHKIERTCDLTCVL